MNFRYQAIIFGFLAVAIHFHTGESIGTVSLAQSAAPATAAVNPDDPNLAFQEFKETTKEDRQITFRLQERKKDPKNQSASSFFNRGNAPTSDREVVLTAVDADGKILTNSEGDVLKLFGDCDSGCKSEIVWNTNLENAKSLTEILAAIEKGKANYDALEKKKTEQAKLDAEKKLKCEGIAKAEDTAKCLGERYADTSLTEEQRRMIRDRLVEIVRYGIDSNPQATIDFLSANPTIRGLIPSQDMTEIADRGGEFLAGKSAFTSASTIQRAIDVCFDAASTGRGDCLRARENARRRNASAKTEFEKAFRGAFGTSGIGRVNLNDTWSNANYKHDRSVQSLFSLTNNREMNMRILAGAEVMGAADDTRPSMNSLRNNILSNGNLDDDDAIINVNGRVGTRNSRRVNNDLSFGGCRYQNNQTVGGLNYGRPGILNCVFDDYVRTLDGQRNIAGSLLTANQLAAQSQIQNSVFTNSNFNTGNSIISSGGRMGNGRPGARM